MEFRVLGPVELWTGETAVRAGEPRQRAVLAGLVVDAGRTVGTDTLVDRVWGEDPPQQARRTLHAHISRIRGQLARLGAEPAPQLLRSSAGYRLVVEPERVDLLRFRALVERARADGMAAADRAAVLREAVGLWRGPPLAGLSGSWAERMRESWGRERIDALLAWFDAEIRVGGAAAVLAAAADLVAEQPLLEPATAALMRALHAVGRQSDALSVFAAMRTRLRDELGVDPGAELRATPRGRAARPAADRRALRSGRWRRRCGGRAPGFRRSCRPTSAGSPAVATSWPRSRRCCPRATDDTEPAAMVIAAIVGTAGVGKTALAVRWAHRVAGRFPDGQLYVNLRGYDPDRPVTPAEALRRLPRALACRPHRIPAELAERGGALPQRARRPADAGGAGQRRRRRAGAPAAARHIGLPGAGDQPRVEEVDAGPDRTADDLVDPVLAETCYVAPLAVLAGWAEGHGTEADFRDEEPRVSKLVVAHMPLLQILVHCKKIGVGRSPRHVTWKKLGKLSARRRSRCRRARWSRRRRSPVRSRRTCP